VGRDPFSEIDWDRLTRPRPPAGGPGCGFGLLIWVGAGLIGLFVLGLVLTEIYVEYLWFDSLGFSSVYITRLRTQVLAFLGGSLAAAIIFGLNLLVASRVIRRRPRFGGVFREMGGPAIPRPVIGVALAAGSLVFGGLAAGRWLTFLQWVNAEPFGLTEPILGQEIGFYLFSLPVLRFGASSLIAAVIIALIGTGVYYLVSLSAEEGFSGKVVVPGAAVAHLAVVGGVLALALAANYVVAGYEIVYSTRGVVPGASYADVNAQLPAFRALTGLSLLLALSLFAVPLAGLRPAAVLAGIWVAAAVLGGALYPNLVQQFEVRPTELARERPYIENAIRMTRLAFGLDRIREVPYEVGGQLTPTIIQQNRPTLDNVRLWDWRPTLTVYQQVQSIRPYYEFVDVDIDRYVIDGRYRQVLLSARELTDQLPAQADTWQNRHLVFTHGYGVVMNPVNEVGPEGLPRFFIKDIPPTGVIRVERPEIYHGERTRNYVIVNTLASEFDYPRGDENVYATYTGRGGIRLDSWVRRLAFSWFFGDPNIILSNFITDQSRILFRRNIQERLQAIAPFLTFDSDPYIVIADGRLVWIIDAYTTSTYFPHAQFYRTQTANFNYIRNSVKVTVDAYDGTVTFYVFDPQDPLIRVYQKVFPDLFVPVDRAPASIRAHFRYPEGLFRAQAELYRVYHMTDPTVFYNREDLWEIPKELFGARREVVDVEPYYVIMRLPGEPREEFVLIQPFVAARRPNMVAWLAARSDPPAYGDMVVYKFSKETIVFGPIQIEARIDQDPQISAQFTLWSQAGSDVIRGNLLVIPIDRSVIYVEPVYLQAERGQIPELKRVVVAVGDRLAMEASLEEALARVAGIAVPAQPPPTGPPPVPGSLADLARQAKEAYDRALERLRQGDWAGYGEALKDLEAALNRLVQETAPR